MSVRLTVPPWFAVILASTPTVVGLISDSYGVLKERRGEKAGSTRRPDRVVDEGEVFWLTGLVCW